MLGALAASRFSTSFRVGEADLLFASRRLLDSAARAAASARALAAFWKAVSPLGVGLGVGRGHAFCLPVSACPTRTPLLQVALPQPVLLL